MFFRGEQIVRRSGAKKFEEELKHFVEEMSRLSPEREKVHDIMPLHACQPCIYCCLPMCTQIQELLHSLHPSSEQREAAEENCSFQVLDDNISKLLMKLNEEDKLPVIVFWYSSARCVYSHACNDAFRFSLDRVGCEI